MMFQTHPSVEIWTTPPLEPRPLKVNWHRYPDIQHDAATIIVHGHDQRMHQGVWYPSQFRPLAEQDSIETGRPSEELERDLVWARVARDMRVDAFVSASDYLPAMRKGWVSNLIDPTNAVALLALYLRAHDDFTYHIHNQSRFRMNRGSFYFVLARDLLPGSWRWHSALVASSNSTGNGQLRHMGESAMVRLDRVLQARDKMQTILQLEQTSDTADLAFFYLETLLLSLMGAFDAVARVTHLTYGLAGPLYRVGWRRSDWVKDLLKAAGHMAALVARGNTGSDVLQLVASLRNTIHGEFLRSVRYHHRRDMKNPRTLAALPLSETEAVRSCAERLGGLQMWGLDLVDDEYPMLNPAVFVEELLPLAAEVLSRMMETTEVERLPGIDAWNIEARSSSASAATPMVSHQGGRVNIGKNGQQQTSSKLEQKRADSR